MSYLRTLISVAAVVAFLDQLTKVLAARLAEPLVVIPGFFALAYTTNTGIAFSLFQGANILFAAVLALFIIGVLVFYKRIPLAMVIPFGLILGGAAGNLVDRVMIGGVADFISFSFWPTFNLADAAITIGVMLIIIVEIRTPRNHQAS